MGPSGAGPVVHPRHGPLARYRLLRLGVRHGGCVVERRESDRRTGRAGVGVVGVGARGLPHHFVLGVPTLVLPSAAPLGVLPDPRGTGPGPASTPGRRPTSRCTNMPATKATTRSAMCYGAPGGRRLRKQRRNPKSNEQFSLIRKLSLFLVLAAFPDLAQSNKHDDDRFELGVAE